MPQATALSAILARAGITPAQLASVQPRKPAPPRPAPAPEVEPIPAELRAIPQYGGTVSVVPPEIVVAARRGWRLHPVRPKDKLPILKEWQHRATSDLAQIEAWARQYPGCNWGAVAGPESGFFAVDVDNPPAMQRLEDEHGPVPEGLCNVTRRGYQLIYRWPQDAVIRPATDCPCAGIDVRGQDSYIVIPPSVHPSGHVYRYSDDSLPIPACPPWLMDLILSRGRAGAQTRQSVPAAGAVESAPIGKGSRRPTLFKLAGKMRKERVSLEAITETLLALNKTFDPPLDEGTVRKTAQGITRYPGGEAQESPILKPDIVRLADVSARGVDWLWEPFVPQGMLSMISGDPGAGKSFIALAVCADLSRGKLRDGRIVEPMNALYLSVENPLAETIRPRFDSLGGDPSRFFALKGTLFAEDGEEQHGAVTLGDIPILDAAIQQTHARLVVVDPIQSYFGANVDLHRSNETRPVLDGLSKLAESHGCAILLLRHLSKMGGGKAIHRGLGSIDLTGAVRSEMLAGSLPDDPEARALVHIKSNVGRMGRTLGYSIDGEGRFAWTGESQITATDLLAAPEGSDKGAVERAKEWLTALLKSGSKDYTAIRDLAEGEGFKEKSLRRAKAALNIRSRKAAMSGGWIWSLPEGGPKDAPDSDEGRGRLTV